MTALEGRKEGFTSKVGWFRRRPAAQKPKEEADYSHWETRSSFLKMLNKYLNQQFQKSYYVLAKRTFLSLKDY